MYINSEIQFKSRNSMLRRWCIWIGRCLKTPRAGSMWEIGLMSKEPHSLRGLLADLLIAAAELLLCLRWLGKQGWHCAVQHLKPLTAQMSCIVQDQFNGLTVTNLTSAFRNMHRKLTLLNEWGSCRYITTYIYISLVMKAWDTVDYESY